MIAPPSAAKLFKAEFTAPSLHKIFDEHLSSGASVGRDGTKLEMFKTRLDDEINIILRKVKATTYEFTGYKEKLISKGAGKYPRQLSIPTIRDKLLLKFLALLLARIYPEHASSVPHPMPKAEAEKIKRFVNAYYAIKFHVAKTTYIPNFDTFDLEQKKEQLAILLPKKQIDTLSEGELNELFYKTIQREIGDLEMDMMEVFS